MVWIDLAQNRDRWRESVDVVMNSYEFSGSTKFGECLDRLKNHWLIKKATVICLAI